MCKAPKEIWCSTGLYYEYKTDWSEGEWHARPDFSCVKYVRADRIEELEDKLAKAMEHVADYSNDPHLWKWAYATLAELKGEKDE